MCSCFLRFIFKNVDKIILKSKVYNKRFFHTMVLLINKEIFSLKKK